MAARYDAVDASTAAAAVRRGDVMATELVDAVLEQHAADDEINAIVTRCAERAREEAARVDRAVAAGEPVGPLAGVPITIKEAFHTLDLPTTWGLPEPRNWIADRDAIVVDRLRAAGAIVFGKTNVAPMLADFAQTANEVYGRTNNPYDVTRSPGGSSGGSAAAVAAGLTFLEFGSDLAGSIRIPASFCGVYGLRPSANTIPQDGFAPPNAPFDALPPDVGWISTVGPIARSVADVRLALELTRRVVAASPRAVKPLQLNGLRVGVVLDDVQCPLASDVGEVLSGAIDSLGAAGVEIHPGWPAGVDSAAATRSFGFALQRFLAAADPSAEWTASNEEVEDERRRLEQRRPAWARYFDDIEAFLCPVDFTAAIKHDDRPFDERRVRTVDGERRYDEQPFWTAQPAAAGLPALAVPAGRTAGGLPVGLQVVGPPDGDDRVLDVAELVADVLGGYHPPPGLA